jgi:hypothetical protein
VAAAAGIPAVEAAAGIPAEAAAGIPAEAAAEIPAVEAAAVEAETRVRHGPLRPPMARATLTS